jgi:hypothetical protein
MRFVAPILQFLKRHYEKIILCVVLLGLAGAATWMGAEISKYKSAGGPAVDAPHSSKPMPPVDLSSDIGAWKSLANPPPVVLSGDHNLFNPVTWKRENNGRLLKILRTGPDALKIVDVAPLYTVISYSHPTGTAGIYVFTVQTNSGRRMTEHPKLNEKTKSGLYIVHGIKGAPENPTELELVITATQQKVWISQTNDYKEVDGHTVDLFYPPENHSMSKQHVNEEITLDGQKYKIVEITDDTVRVQNEQNSKMTTVRKQ